MNIDRRGFFKVMSVGALTALGSPKAEARAPKTLSPQAVGLLYDATLCIGCKACEVACKEANDMPPVHDTAAEQVHGVSGVWDADNDLSSDTLNKIKVYTHGTAEVKDRAQNGYSFVKRNCMHCVDPDCVSACPVSALIKDPVTGIVKYNPDACIGCRYCQIACPFNIPKFEYDEALPEIVKCQMCAHKVEDGGLPACCEACPTGASLFGPVEALQAEAHRRLSLTPGERQEYPVHSLASGDTRETTVASYYPHIYGETESGGTQYMLLAGVPFEKLGLPDVGDRSSAQRSESIQHMLYEGMIAPTLLLGGLVYTAYKHTRGAEAAETAQAEAAAAAATEVTTAETRADD